MLLSFFFFFLIKGILSPYWDLVKQMSCPPAVTSLSALHLSRSSSQPFSLIMQTQSSQHSSDFPYHGLRITSEVSSLLLLLTQLLPGSHQNIIMLLTETDAILFMGEKKKSVTIYDFKRPKKKIKSKR